MAIKFNALRVGLEVGGSHIGMGWNRVALAAVTDRLAEHTGLWLPYVPEG